MSLKLGKYICEDGAEYIVTDIAKNMATNEGMVISHSAGNDGEVWVCPINGWNGYVNKNGTQVKCFTHVDDIKIPSFEPPADLPKGIHKRSPSVEKIELFLSMFTGRTDVYAKRYENSKSGKAGYVPACFREWSPLCPKSGGGKMKCSECPNQGFITFDSDIVEKHLSGRLTAGAYAMLPDETCRFLAFDFDGKEYSQDVLHRDVSAIREECNANNISVAVERSRSGNGIHFWIFFAKNIPASVARKLGSSIITSAMNKHHRLALKTYDRLIPNQDTLPKGGFGNLIALPLQKKPRENQNSEFIDENFNAYDDQWNYLYGIKKYTLEEVEAFTKQLSPNGELGILRKDTDEDKVDEEPWKIKKSNVTLTKSDFPDKVKIVSANMLYIDKTGISSPALNTLKRLAAFSNPEFYKNQAMRLSTHDKPRIISCADETEQYICLPRGLADDVNSILDYNGVKINRRDETNAGRRINVSFNGELRDEQQQAADALLKYSNGILSATTAFGKTVIGAWAGTAFSRPVCNAPC